MLSKSIRFILGFMLIAISFVLLFSLITTTGYFIEPINSMSQSNPILLFALGLIFAFLGLVSIVRQIDVVKSGPKYGEMIRQFEYDAKFQRPIIAWKGKVRDFMRILDYTGFNTDIIFTYKEGEDINARLTFDFPRPYDRAAGYLERRLKPERLWGRRHEMSPGYRLCHIHAYISPEDRARIASEYHLQLSESEDKINREIFKIAYESDKEIEIRMNAHLEPNWYVMKLRDMRNWVRGMADTHMTRGTFTDGSSIVYRILKEEDKLLHLPPIERYEELRKIISEESSKIQAGNEASKENKQ